MMPVNKILLKAIQTLKVTSQRGHTHKKIQTYILFLFFRIVSFAFSERQTLSSSSLFFVFLFAVSLSVCLLLVRALQNDSNNNVKSSFHQYN